MSFLIIYLFNDSIVLISFAKLSGRNDAVLCQEQNFQHFFRRISYNSFVFSDEYCESNTI